MLQNEPYFMKNPEWYYHDRKKMKFFLTDKAPKEAVQSYKEFYDNTFDFTCQSVMNDFDNECKNELLEIGVPEAKANEIMEIWNSPNNHKSFNELKAEVIKELNLQNKK